MSQLTLAAAGAEVVADAEGVGVVQVALGLAEAVAVAEVLGAAESVGIADVAGALVGGAGWWWRRHQRPGIWAAATAALAVTEVLGVTDGLGTDVLGATATVGIAEEVVAGVVVPGVADDVTQAAPRATSLVESSFVPECDEISIPAATPSTATSSPAIAPRRALGRSSTTW